MLMVAHEVSLRANCGATPERDDLPISYYAL